MPDRAGCAFDFVPDWPFAVVGSGEVDHAGSNHHLVCQCSAMDVERKWQVVTVSS